MKKKILLLLFSCLIGLTILEIGTRLIMPRPHPSKGLLRPLVDDPLLFEYIPNVQVDDVKINSFGFRDDEFHTQKDSGEYRIEWIGDSIVMGWGVKKNERFTDIINAEFVRHHLKVRTLNLGVESYSNFQELLTIQKKGIELKPDLIIVEFCWNDILKYEHFIDLTGRNQFLLRNNEPFAKQNASNTIIQMCSSVLGRSQLFSLTRREIFDRFLPQRKTVETQSFDAFFRWYSEAWKSAQVDSLHKQIDAMSALAAKSNSNIIFLIFPMSFQIERSNETEQYAIQVDSSQKEFETYLSSKRIQYFDLKDGLSKWWTSDNRKCYLDVWHFNREGHRRAASLITEYLDNSIKAWP